jgi:hypothetical protein
LPGAMFAHANESRGCGIVKSEGGCEIIGVFHHSAKKRKKISLIA